MPVKYCWHVFWDHDRRWLFLCEPTEVYARSSVDAVRAAIIIACQKTGLEPEELPDVLSVLEVLDPGHVSGGTEGGNW